MVRHCVVGRGTHSKPAQPCSTLHAPYKYGEQHSPVQYTSAALPRALALVFSSSSSSRHVPRRRRCWTERALFRSLGWGRGWGWDGMRPNQTKAVPSRPWVAETLLDCWVRSIVVISRPARLVGHVSRRELAAPFRGEDGFAGRTEGVRES